MKRVYDSQFKHPLFGNRQMRQGTSQIRRLACALLSAQMFLCMAFFVGFAAAQEPCHSTAVGTVRIEHVQSRWMQDDVSLHIWLPPGYDDPENRNRRYPVLYMFDGQNLFDVCGSMNHDEWQIDETLTALINQRAVQPIIVVGIDAPDDGPLRGSRYVPFEDAMSPFPFEPHGDRMPFFLEAELLPFVNQLLRTQVGRTHTAIGGASYGAIAALYALIMRPHVFGLGLIESPWSTPGNGALVRMTENLTMPPTRATVGVGDNEASLYADKMRARDLDPAILNRTLARDARLIAEHLRNSADSATAVQFSEVPEGDHSEASWRRRFPQDIRFLFPPAASDSTPLAR